MKALFDTNVLIAALVESHAHYTRARPCFEKVIRGEIEMVVSAHSLMEFYSTLTKYPSNSVPPKTAHQLVYDEIVLRGEIFALTTADYMNVLNSVSITGLSGGIVFDAIIVEVAKLANVDQLLSFNTKHLLRIWPEGSNIIQEP